MEGAVVTRGRHATGRGRGAHHTTVVIGVQGQGVAILSVIVVEGRRDIVGDLARGLQSRLKGRAVKHVAARLAAHLKLGTAAAIEMSENY